jgi:hypothetical protein
LFSNRHHNLIIPNGRIYCKASRVHGCNFFFGAKRESMIYLWYPREEIPMDTKERENS